VNALKHLRVHLATLVSPDSWRTLGHYVGFRKHAKKSTIENADDLVEFISSRASHVTQTSLYGYLRTRAGTRFPELFENPDILISINLAKWHIWLACVSDLCIFTGQIMYQSGRVNSTEIELLMSPMLDRVLQITEVPLEAGDDFESAAEKERLRIKSCDWSIELDDDSIFSASPSALYYWSPIADELKERDEIIVRNSVRFRWIEVRRSTRQQLNIELIFRNQSSPQTV
jgi:hypothetical protein